MGFKKGQSGNPAGRPKGIPNQQAELAVRSEVRSVYQRKPPNPDRWETNPNWFCGAKNRAGLPCRMLAIHENGRCKWHGGCATGPKTEAGKDQARINGRKGGRPRKNRSHDY